MNIFFSFSRGIIRYSFDFSVWLISKFSDKQYLDDKVKQLHKLRKGTLGKETANSLDRNNLHLIAGFESHDLKHVLLGYEMTPVDEIRLQAFMLGNRNYTFPCFAILTFGMVLLPCKWPILLKDFKKGRRSTAVSLWTLEEYAHRDINELRNLAFNTTTKTNINMQNLVKLSAITVTVAGVAGMVFCLPFLFSSNVADLVGAGFPFVGGAILTSGGLIALSAIGKQTYIPNTIEI